MPRQPFQELNQIRRLSRFVADQFEADKLSREAAMAISEASHQVLHQGGYLPFPHVRPNGDEYPPAPVCAQMLHVMKETLRDIDPALLRTWEIQESKLDLSGPSR